MSDEVLARKQQEIETEQARLMGLAAKSRLDLEDVEDELAQVLERTKTPHATYKTGTPLRSVSERSESATSRATGESRALRASRAPNSFAA